MLGGDGGSVYNFLVVSNRFLEDKGGMPSDKTAQLFFEVKGTYALSSPLLMIISFIFPSPLFYPPLCLLVPS